MTSTDIMLPPQLWDGEVPQIVMADDSARARRTDPRTSHIAGDISQHSLRRTKRVVLQLVLQEGELSGSELNDLYNIRAARQGWRNIAWDSPRKRAGELEDDGYLSVVGERPARNGAPERVFALTERGRDAVRGFTS